MATKKRRKPKVVGNCLAPEDLAAMRIAAAEGQRALERHGRIKAERDAEVYKAEIAFIRAERHRADVHQTRENTLKHEGEKLAEALAEQQNLAAEIANRYAVDWKATAFDSTTGLLSPLPR